MKKYLSLIIYGSVTLLFLIFAVVGCADYPAQEKAAREEAVKAKGYENPTPELMDQVQLPSKVEAQITGSAVADWLIPVAYILVGAAIFFAILLPLFYAITQDPKSLVKVVASVGILLVLFFVCYLFADDNVVKTTDVEMDGSGSKLIGGALIMTYVMIAMAFIGAVFGEIARSFNR